jgi:uncharacterized protein (DUF779 family)
MCFQDGEFRVGASDMLIGEIHGCRFYISKSQFEHWKDTHLTIDVTPGRGASFSLEIPLGLRFVQLVPVRPRQKETAPRAGPFRFFARLSRWARAFDFRSPGLLA